MRTIERCWLSTSSFTFSLPLFTTSAQLQVYPRKDQFRAPMSTASSDSLPSWKVIDSHLHVWASPDEAAEKYPYFPGQVPSLRGDLDFLLQCMNEAAVDGALIVQPINHMFDHSLVTSVLKKYPSKFVGCCLANPADDGIGLQQLEHLVVEMTNKIGKELFSKAGKLGVPVGFMCMKGLSLHTKEIEDLCAEFPSTTVLLDHLAFCKPPM